MAHDRSSSLRSFTVRGTSPDVRSGRAGREWRWDPVPCLSLWQTWTTSASSNLESPTWQETRRKTRSTWTHMCGERMMTPSGSALNKQRLPREKAGASLDVEWSQRSVYLLAPSLTICGIGTCRGDRRWKKRGRSELKEQMVSSEAWQGRTDCFGDGRMTNRWCFFFLTI
uniref:Uncharacterized protein n=1 Tax=Hyaloperonospora arabidopsidis (strain Emoy2) TaxID=559515 RepID=M4B645_HYAAE